jgi:hypothetical protein
LSSTKKIAANRANARKSTGPKTPAGKEASCRNSLVHGLTAEVLLLDHEDPAEFQALRRAMFEMYPPTDALDGSYVDRLVSLVWRLRRVPVFEAGLVAWTKHRQHVEYDATAGKDKKESQKAPLSAKGGAFRLAEGQLSEADLERLRFGRVLEALLERNLLGKLDDHEARLTRQLRYVLDWLECQKQARATFMAHRKASGATDVEALSEEGASTNGPASPVAEAGDIVASEVSDTPVKDSIVRDWEAASVRGPYVPASVREARKQQALASGGSANTST